MPSFALGLALQPALASIGIGALYAASPATATRGFGRPLPGAGTTLAWWLRLIGVCEILPASIVLALVPWGGTEAVGIVRRVEAIIPAGDTPLILAAKGSTRRAFGLHGFTAVLMILAAILLIVGAP